VRIAVLNGANLDALAFRDPTLYGGLSYQELETRIYDWARALDLTVRCFQTNHEGAYIDWCHEARSWADGVVANPGAWTHYSYAIRDALEIAGVPAIEVHLSDVSSREEWRHKSVLDGLVTDVVSGQGEEGYRVALEIAKEALG